MAHPRSRLEGAGSPQGRRWPGAHERMGIGNQPRKIGRLTSIESMRVLIAILGVVATLWVFMAIVKVMLVPRGSRSVVVASVNGFVRAVSTAPLSMIKGYKLRDRWLAGAAPMAVLLELVAYVVLLILTLGLVVYGTTSLSVVDSLYQSGATLTTLGIVEPVNVPSTITTFVAAFFGLVVIAIFIGYLLAILGAFTSREGPMARLALLSGEPAWGPEILARGYATGMPADSAPDCEAWTGWVTETRMNTQVNAVLAHFRSTSPHRHWIISLLAVLDATALRISIANAAKPEEIRLIGAGTVAASVLSGRRNVHNWQVEDAVQVILDNPGAMPLGGRPHLSPQDLDDAWTALRQVDFPLPDDMAGATQRFLGLRCLYADDVLALADRLQAVPAPWSGERNPPMATIWPEIASRPGAAP